MMPNMEADKSDRLQMKLFDLEDAGVTYSEDVLPDRFRGNPEKRGLTPAPMNVEELTKILRHLGFSQTDIDAI